MIGFSNETYLRIHGLAADGHGAWPGPDSDRRPGACRGAAGRVEERHRGGDGAAVGSGAVRTLKGGYAAAGGHPRSSMGPHHVRQGTPRSLLHNWNKIILEIMDILTSSMRLSRM